MGVPQEWISDVKAADEDVFLDLVEHLPAEAAERILELATAPETIVEPAFAEVRDKTPSGSMRIQMPSVRFRLMTNVEELESALEFPWEKWTVFTPEQRHWAEREYNGPAKVAGSGHG